MLEMWWGRDWAALLFFSLLPVPPLGWIGEQRLTSCGCVKYLFPRRNPPTHPPKVKCGGGRVDIQGDCPGAVSEGSRPAEAGDGHTMGGGGSKWRKAAVGPPLPAAGERELGCSEEGAGGEGLQRWDGEGRHRLWSSRAGTAGAGDWPPVMEREAGKAAAEGGDWSIQAEGGSSRRSQPSTWKLPKAPCGDCTPSIQCLAGGQRGASGGGSSPDNPRPPRAAGAWPSALSGCSLSTSRRSPGSAHVSLSATSQCKQQHRRGAPKQSPFNITCNISNRA